MSDGLPEVVVSSNAIVVRALVSPPRVSGLSMTAGVAHSSLKPSGYVKVEGSNLLVRVTVTDGKAAGPGQAV